MGVEEILAGLPRLDAAERQRVRAMLEAMEAEERAADELAKRRGEDAWDRLLAGYGTAGGQHLSAGIDQALYGGEA